MFHRKYRPQYYEPLFAFCLNKQTKITVRTKIIVLCQKPDHNVDDIRYFQAYRGYILSRERCRWYKPIQMGGYLRTNGLYIIIAELCFNSRRDPEQRSCRWALSCANTKRRCSLKQAHSSAAPIRPVKGRNTPKMWDASHSSIITFFWQLYVDTRWQRNNDELVLNIERKRVSQPATRKSAHAYTSTCTTVPEIY